MMLRDALTRDSEIDSCTSLLRALSSAEGFSFIGSTVGRARRSSGSSRRQGADREEITAIENNRAEE